MHITMMFVLILHICDFLLLLDFNVFWNSHNLQAYVKIIHDLVLWLQ
jgi:hypothetical protein